MKTNGTVEKYRQGRKHIKEREEKRFETSGEKLIKIRFNPRVEIRKGGYNRKKNVL